MFEILFNVADSSAGFVILLQIILVRFVFVLVILCVFPIGAAGLLGTRACG